MQYDRTTRWIHAALVFFILVQLTTSLIMRLPGPARTLTPLEAGSFLLHRLTGVGVLFVLTVHWLWILSGHLPEGLGHLFPWSSREKLDKALEDMKPLLRFKIRDLPEKSALAGAVEGLGLIVATLMAVTGAVLFFGISVSGTMSPAVHAVKEIHSFIATFLWIYLIGHASMGVIHQLLGHRTLSRMFNLTLR